MQVERVKPENLTFADIVAWRRFVEAQPSLSSPFLTPEWAQTVARHRADAEVVVFRKGERAVGFLPVQRPNAYAALPIGGPVCDYQALIGPSDPSYDLAEAARALDVGRIDFTCGLRESGLGKGLLTQDAGLVARFDQGWEAFAADLKAAGSSGIADAARRLRQLSEQHPGAVRFEAFSTDPDAFDQLIAWKRTQLAGADAADLFDHAWIRNLVRETFDAPRTTTFGGALFVLRVAGRPVAAMHCVAARKTLHAWIVAHDPAYAAHAPALCVIVGAMRAAERAGFQEMDFGPGPQTFKDRLANVRRPCGAGFIGRPGVAAAMRQAEYGLRAFVEGLPVGPARAWPAKVMRRNDMAAGLSAAVQARPGKAA